MAAAAAVAAVFRGRGLMRYICLPGITLRIRLIGARRRRRLLPRLVVLHLIFPPPPAALWGAHNKFSF